jgi:hypothetical protein
MKTSGCPEIGTFGDTEAGLSFPDIFRQLLAHVHHVAIRPEPNVVRQVPACIVRIIVQHDVIGIPEPVVAKTDIIRRDGEEESADLEAVRTSAMQTPHMASANGSRETTVLPRTIEMIVLIVRHMAYPSIVLRMNVRRLGMAFLIAVAGARFVRWPATFTVWWMVGFATIRLPAARRTVRGNVPIAYALIRVLLASALSSTACCSAASLPAALLRVSAHDNGNISCEGQCDYQRDCCGGHEPPLKSRHHFLRYCSLFVTSPNAFDIYFGGRELFLTYHSVPYLEGATFCTACRFPPDFPAEKAGDSRGPPSHLARILMP